MHLNNLQFLSLIWLLKAVFKPSDYTLLLNNKSISFSDDFCDFTCKYSDIQNLEVNNDEIIITLPECANYTYYDIQTIKIINNEIQVTTSKSTYPVALINNQEQEKLALFLQNKRTENNLSISGSHKKTLKPYKSIR